MRSFNPHYPIFNVIHLSICHSEGKTWAYLDLERRDHNQYIHSPQSIWNYVARYFTFFFFPLKNQITEDWFLTLVKCCFCEEWRHCSSEVLLFILMNQNLAIWHHLIPTIQSLMWSTCQYATLFSIFLLLRVFIVVELNF